MSQLAQFTGGSVGSTSITATNQPVTIIKLTDGTANRANAPGSSCTAYFSATAFAAIALAVGNKGIGKPVIVKDIPRSSTLKVLKKFLQKWA